MEGYTLHRCVEEEGTGEGRHVMTRKGAGRSCGCGVDTNSCQAAGDTRRGGLAGTKRQWVHGPTHAVRRTGVLRELRKRFEKRDRGWLPSTTRSIRAHRHRHNTIAMRVAKPLQGANRHGKIIIEIIIERREEKLNRILKIGSKSEDN